MKRISLFLITLFWLTACSHVSPPSSSAHIGKNGAWVLLPFNNMSETPKAGERAESIASSLLHSKGYQLSHYPAHTDDSLVLLLDDNKRRAQAKQWAKQQGYRYALTGDVTEWRYKTGLDADPSIGISLRVIDLSNDATLYNRTGSKVGWGYSNLSQTAQNLMKKMLSEI